MSETSLKGFLERLHKSRLLSEDVINSAMAAYSGNSSRSLAKRLVHENKLTSWQAKQLLAGRESFHVGGYKVFRKNRQRRNGDCL